MEHQPKRPARREPTFEEAVQIHQMLSEGLYQHEIASIFGYNQGRISDVKRGVKHPKSKLVAFG